jgi:hypothetical protein
MARDVRGNPGRFEPKNQPRLNLKDLLRRRKMTLMQFLSEFGITTYEGLAIRCDRMGVTPPSQQDFNAVIPPEVYVNSPTEGVVVLEALPVIAESTGEVLPDEETPPEAAGSPVMKRPRRKKEDRLAS